jgi:hypothetical protein
MLSPSENTEKYLVLQHFSGVNVQLSFSIIFYIKIVLLISASAAKKIERQPNG